MNETIISKAMQCPDDLVISLDYVDAKGRRTERVVSPIRFVGTSRFLALCLSRCAPRQFEMQRCSNVRLRRAHEFVMPVPMHCA
jgi:predicted DNA-binding transcriptional regulator YafY